MGISSEIGNVSGRGNDSYENSVFGREDSFGKNSISDVGDSFGGNGISDAGGDSGKDNETDTGSCLEWNGLSLRPMEVAYKQELETGPASILCCVGGEVREYDAEITRIDMNHEDSNKSFVIRVTDPDLINPTGGIVQGMSGSPVLQHNKFAGAVTHVFVQDSATGYGIFAETMLEQNS